MPKSSVPVQRGNVEDPAAASRSAGRQGGRAEDGAQEPSAAAHGRQDRPGRHAQARALCGAIDTQERVVCDHVPLLSFDEGTLLEVLVRLGVADLANTACTCKAFAEMCRSECLWRQLSALRGIRILECDAPGASGWRQIYVALCKVEVVAWSPLALAELKRLCQLFTAVRVPPRHYLVCVELQLAAAEGSGRPVTLSHSSSAHGPESPALGPRPPSASDEPWISGTHAGSFRFGGERWTCRLSTTFDDYTDQPSAGSPSEAQQTPTMCVHMARVESDHKSEPPGWFHILSAQAQIILPGQDCIGPVTNGVIALGKVPAGLQMHVDIPEVRQSSADVACSTWEHEDEVSVCGTVDRRIAKLIARQRQQRQAHAGGGATGSHACFAAHSLQQPSLSAAEETQPATIKLVLMLGSLQCSRQFFREIYGSIIYCCEEQIKSALLGAPTLPHGSAQEHAPCAQASAVSGGRIREVAEDWWNTYRLGPSRAVHAFGNSRALYPAWASAWLRCPGTRAAARHDRTWRSCMLMHAGDVLWWRERLTLVCWAVVLFLQTAGCYRHLALEHFTATTKEGQASIETHITRLVSRLVDDERRNPNSYLSPVMVKEEMWQIFRAHLKGFCRLWVQAAPTRAMLQALDDEKLWAWFAGLSVARFLPLRHSCTYIGMHLVLALAAEAKEAYQAAMLGRNLLCVFRGVALEDDEDAVGDQRKEGTNVSARGARGRTASDWCKGGREAGHVPTGRKAVKAEDEDIAQTPLQTMSFGDLVRAAREWKPVRGHAEAGDAANIRDSRRGQDAESAAAAGGTALQQRKQAVHEPAHRRGGMWHQHARGESHREAALRRFWWLVQCWREQKHGILRCAPNGQDGDGAEMEALLLHVFECGGGRCLVICHADSVHDWQERLLSGAAKAHSLELSCGQGRPALSVCVCGTSWLPSGQTLPSSGFETAGGLGTSSDSRIGAEADRSGTDRGSADDSFCFGSHGADGGKLGSGAGHAHVVIMSYEAAHRGDADRLGVDLIIVDQRPPGVAETEAGARQKPAMDARSRSACTGCEMRASRGMDWSRVALLTAQHARCVPRIMMRPDVVADFDLLGFCDAILREPDSSLGCALGAQGDDAISTQALVGVIGEQLKLLHFVQPLLFSHAFLRTGDAETLMQHSPNDLMPALRAFAAVLVDSSFGIESHAPASAESEEDKGKYVAAAQAAILTGAGWSTQLCCACRTKRTEIMAQVQQAEERLGCLRKMTDLLMKSVPGIRQRDMQPVMPFKWCKALGECTKLWPDYYLNKETLKFIAENLEDANPAAKGSALKALICIFSKAEGGPALPDASSLHLIRTAVTQNLTCILRLCQDDNAKNAGRALKLLTLLVNWKFVDHDACYSVCRAVLQRPMSALQQGKCREHAIDLFHLVFAKRCVPLCLDRQEAAEREGRDCISTEGWTTLLATTRAGNDSSSTVASAATDLARSRCVRKARCLQALALVLNEFACSAPTSLDSCELIEALMFKEDETGAMLRNWPWVFSCLLHAEALNALKKPAADVLAACSHSPAKRAAAECRSSSAIPGSAPDVGEGGQSKSSPARDSNENNGWMGSVCDIVILSLLHSCREVASPKPELVEVEAGAGAAREMQSDCKKKRKTAETAGLRLLSFLADSCSPSAPCSSVSSQHAGKLDKIAKLVSCIIPGLPLPGCDSSAETGDGAQTRAERCRRAVAQLMARVCTRKSLQERLALFQLSLN